MKKGIVLDDFKDESIKKGENETEDPEEQEEKVAGVMSHREMTEICMDKMDGRSFLKFHEF